MTRNGAARQWLRDAWAYLRLCAAGRCIVLRRFSHALGDNLMLTCLAREVRRAVPDRQVVIETTRPELFRRNPHVALAVRSKLARRPWRPAYRIGGPGTAHVLDQLVGSLPVRIERWERRLELYLDDSEHEALRRRLPSDFIAVAPQGKGTAAANRKDWGVDRFQALVDSMPHRSFVQIGLREDRLLDGVVDLRGLDVPASAFVVRSASVSVLLEGGFMHVANAVGAPAIVLFGNALAPGVTGYADQLSVAAPTPCGPCFRTQEWTPPCDHMSCMARITPDLVRALIEERGYVDGGVREVE